MRKFLSLACLSTTVLAALTGCSKITEGGDSVIQVRVYNGGYGTAWLHEIANKFHDAFPQYTVKFEEESSLVSQTAGNEMLTPNKNQIDLYFSNGSDVSTLISKSKGVLKTSNKTLLEPLNDIFESKAIGYNGKEESKTIKERFFLGYEEAMTYNGIVEKWHGNMYSLPWSDATTGVFVNKKVLDKYGLDLPLTSDEFVHTMEVIASHTKEDKVYPYSFGGNNAPGYWLYLYETWFAQYAGQESFMDFMRCDPGDGDIEHNGYKVYQNPAIYETLKVFEKFMKLDYSSNGSVNKMHTEAQNEFLRDKSAYFVNGEWLLHEMYGDYKDEAEQILMLKTPILSVIGTEAGLTDAQLHTVVQAIDEKKTNSEIQALIPTASDAFLARVREARSIHDCIGVGHTMQIPSSSDCIDATKKFIRFIYSEDGCRSFRNVAKGNMPLQYEINDTCDKTPFQLSVDNVLRCDNPRMVSGSIYLNDVREISQMYMFNVTAWQHPTTFKSMMINEGVVTAEKIFNDEKAYMQSSWSKYMSYVF